MHFLCRVIEKHPSLALAARNLLAAVQSEVLTSPSTSTSSAQSLHNMNFLASDDEDMDGLVCEVLHEPLRVGWHLDKTQVSQFCVWQVSGDTQNRTLETSEEGEQPVNVITPSQVAAALASTTGWYMYVIIRGNVWTFEFYQKLVSEKVPLFFGGTGFYVLFYPFHKIKVTRWYFTSHYAYKVFEKILGKCRMILEKF